VKILVFGANTLYLAPDCRRLLLETLRDIKPDSPMFQFQIKEKSEKIFFTLPHLTVSDWVYIK
jgi:hypothetical protein